MWGLSQDLRHTVRLLVKSPGFLLVAVLTLAIGIGVNTTVFSVINGMILRPLPVPHPEQIALLAAQQEGSQDYEPFSYPDYLDIQRQSDGFSDVLAYRVSLVGLTVDGKGEHCVISRVTGNFFSTAGVQPAAGRLILPSEGRTPGADPIFVLGYSYWQRRFGGDKGVIGKQVEMDGHPVTIVGVAPKDFTGLYAFLNMDGYIPLSAMAGLGGNAPVEDTWTHRDERSLQLRGRLKPGVSLEQAEASLQVVARRLAEQHPDTDKGLRFSAFPEKLARPEPDPDGTLPKISIAFTILSALVLLVACFNIANILLVRATARQREMAIRAAIGAGWGRLVRQSLTESLLLALVGGSFGLLFGWWASGFLSAIPLGTDLPIQFNFQPDVRVYLFTGTVVLLTAIVVGVIPAIPLARTDVNHVLREGSRGSSDGKRRNLMRNSLVVAQLAGSLLLLVVAGLFIRSLGKAERLYLGFASDHLINAAIDIHEIGYQEARGKEFFRAAEEKLLRRFRKIRSPQHTSKRCAFQSNGGGPSMKATTKTRRTSRSSTKPWRESSGRTRMRSASGLRVRTLSTNGLSSKSWALPRMASTKGWSKIRCPTSTSRWRRSTCPFATFRCARACRPKPWSCKWPRSFRNWLRALPFP